MDTQSLYQIYKKHPVISTDTRSITKNSIFFALKGANFNGNQFADHAIKAGASYVVIDEIAYRKDERYLLVDDVLNALQELAKYHRDQLTIPVIGITGTNGKTTTKEMTHAVLSQKYKVLATKGNLNNHIGVPLTLLSIGPETEIAIIEMGANHVGEIAFLCSLSQPSHGLITNVGRAHHEGFGSFEGVKIAKGELYRYLENNGGVKFINADSQHLMGMSKSGAQTIKYGSSASYDIIGELFPGKAFCSFEWHQKSAEKKWVVNSKLVGDYNFENILAAVCIGDFFGLTAEQINKGVETYMPANNRSQLIEKNTNSIIMDAYNANPSSMKAAIENLDRMDAPYKVAILGDMFEMGEESKAEHSALIKALSDTSIQEKIVVGNEFFALKDQVSTIQFCKDTTEAIQYIKNKNYSKACILIKGSRGMKMETILEVL